MPLRLAYSTNGFADHRLTDALRVISGLGYDGVALTLDHQHLDPFAPDLSRRVAQVRRALDDTGLDVAVETGARYLLDPWHKHQPTLLSSEGRELRLDLLQRAIDVTGELGATVTHLWSGTPPPEVSHDLAWERLLSGVAELLPRAEAAGVTLAFEPEPGMLVASLADWAQLRDRLGSPDALRLTLDVGHCRCLEDRSPEQCVTDVGHELAHVQIEDMRRGVHEHLPFGDGEMDFPPLLAALSATGYTGLVTVELPRHSHAATATARHSIGFLRAAEATARGTVPGRRTEASRS
ncbi:sugar phosphate isomerase/epimerase family protein [Streptomyces lonarensis]|uniref:Sugar phosphate isomerase/epimerase n=1 Tax=Streptomyces lonarensis TaxID=700599 RepID=A0A7X6CYY3_9ACTN|nr:sugar phosphate isomerase/epimerase family protein [Streptomyces lonarensis]NJQ05133.1 sugar phosphate isomerase/epimerase [Streptomyces lonarensis]